MKEQQPADKDGGERFRNATTEQKSKMFEWLRKVALAGNPPEFFYAGVAMYELNRLAAPVPESGTLPIAWAIYDRGSDELIDVVLIEPENDSGTYAEPLVPKRDSFSDKTVSASGQMSEIQTSSSDKTDGLPAEVWVVCDRPVNAYQPDFVAPYREAAMEHAAEMSEDKDAVKMFGPFRVARYILASSVPSTTRPLDAAGFEKVEPSMLERLAVEALNEVKAWRDSDGNEGFPHETREKVEAVLMTYEQRRIQHSPVIGSATLPRE